MKKIFTTFLIILAFIGVQAQTKEKAIDVSVGYAISAPYDEVSYSGTGYYAQGEYVYSLNNWVDLRPYAGLILTKMSERDPQINPADHTSTANAFLFGGKARFTVPIPYVAPYVELGIGGSVGSFETITLDTNLKESGVLAHIPFSLGLELGPQHNVNLELSYYYHGSVKQFGGAMAVGLMLPIGVKEPAEAIKEENQ